MIEELQVLLTRIPAPASCMHCFAHIINLISKTVICQFNVPTAKDKVVADVVLRGLRMLAGDIEFEELITRTSQSDNNDIEGDDDNVEGWMDEHENMDECELDELKVDVHPVQAVLVTVHSNCDMEQL